MDMEEIRKFLDGINTKKAEAWKHIYMDYYSPLCCYALKILKDRELSADVVQNVIVRLWENDTHFKDMPSFHGYLYKSVYHNCLKVIRDKNVEDHYLTEREKEEQYFDPVYFAAVIEEEVVRKLRNVIDGMPGKRREVMLLCLEGKRVEEISGLLDISVNTVKKHKKEAYQYIRKLIRPDILILFILLLKNRKDFIDKSNCK